jgi:hypothetical protein
VAIRLKPLKRNIALITRVAITKAASFRAVVAAVQVVA